MFLFCSKLICGCCPSQTGYYVFLALMLCATFFAGVAQVVGGGLALQHDPAACKTSTFGVDGVLIATGVFHALEGLTFLVYLLVPSFNPRLTKSEDNQCDFQLCVAFYLVANLICGILSAIAIGFIQSTVVVGCSPWILPLLSIGCGFCFSGLVLLIYMSGRLCCCSAKGVCCGDD